MEKPNKEQERTPPVVAFRTFDNMIRSLTQAIPSRIDRSVMPSQSGAGQTQILLALRYLDMIETNGAPKEKLIQLVKSEGAERQKVLREILTASYPFLRDHSLDLKTATHDQLADKFKALASGDTVRKCMTFFIPAAKAAGFEMSFIRALGKRTPSNGKARKPRQIIKPRAEKQIDPANTQQQQQPSVMSWHELLLSKFPSFDPSWPDDVKGKWFVSFSELMQRGEQK